VSLKISVKLKSRVGILKFLSKTQFFGYWCRILPLVVELQIGEKAYFLLEKSFKGPLIQAPS